MIPHGNQLKPGDPIDSACYGRYVLRSTPRGQPNTVELDGTSDGIIPSKRRRIADDASEDHNNGRRKDHQLPSQSLLVSEAVVAMTNIIGALERNGKSPIYEWSEFRNTMTAGDDRLKGFFDDLCNAVNLPGKGEAASDTTSRGLIGVCYQLCSLRNRKIKGLKKDIALFLDLAGTSDEGIDTMQKMGLSSSSREVYRVKNAVAEEHEKYVASVASSHIDKGAASIGNLDDYHNIHTIRRPDTTTTSWAAHMATNILIPVDFPAFPILI
jgi:hypothetical protein